MSRDNIDGGESTSRRKFLLKSGAASVGIPFIAGSATAVDGVGSLAKTQPNGTSPMKMGQERDTVSDGYTGSQQLTIHRYGGTPTGSTTFIPVDVQASVETHTRNNYSVDNIDSTETTVRWNNNGPGTVNDGSPNKYNTGGYYGSFVRNDNYSFADAVLDSAHNLFLGWLTGPVSALVYPAFKLTSDIFNKYVSSSGGGNYESRTWTWNSESNVTNWSEYPVRVEQNSVFDLKISNYATLFGGLTLFNFVTVRILGATWNATEIDKMTAQEAEEREIEVYDLEAVEKNPRKYRVTPALLKSYEGDYLYKVPIETRVVNSGRGISAISDKE